MQPDKVVSNKRIFRETEDVLLGQLSRFYKTLYACNHVLACNQCLNGQPPLFPISLEQICLHPAIPVRMNLCKFKL